MTERKTSSVAFFTLIVVFYLCYLALFSASDDPVSTNSLQLKNSFRTASAQEKATKSLWKSLEVCFDKSRPSNPAPQRAPLGPTDAKFDGGPSYKINMSADDIETMRLAHQTFTQCSQHITFDKVYYPGSRGIVTTGGGKYIPILLVSLRLLRKGGSTLPVEVFLADDSEYEPYFCEKVLPSMNAKCRVLSHILGEKSTFQIETYQYKIFAMMFSSFEDVLFMDADNIAFNDPNILFDSQPYTSHGMVLWPDYWKSSASSQFYMIQGNTSTVKNEHRTSESGQILVSKKKHTQSLLLSSYYNVYGPGYYYSLLSQGSPGEGDKETFSSAANFHDIPYYLVKHKVIPVGFFDKDQQMAFRGQAMLQYDPKEDFEGVEEDHIRPMFAHSNFPKFDPFSILSKGVTGYNSGEKHRIWEDLHKRHYKVSWGSNDPEAKIWDEMLYIACELGDKFLYKPANQSGLCMEMVKHYTSVFGWRESTSTLPNLSS